MSSKVTAPDGTVFRSNRTYTHAVLVGPCDPGKFDEKTGEAIDALGASIVAIEKAIENGTVVSNGLVSWLDGWGEYGIADEGQDPVLVYIYPPGEVETEPEASPVPLLDALRNHAGAEVVRLKSKRAVLVAMRDRVRVGSTTELGTWHVARWCRDHENATVAALAFDTDRAPWGCQVLLARNEEVGS